MPSETGEQDGPHVQDDDQRGVHVDEIHVQSPAVQCPPGLVQEESGVRTSIAPELGEQAQSDQQSESGEKARPARGMGSGCGQGRGVGADSSAESTQGATCGELYWPRM